MIPPAVHPSDLAPISDPSDPSDPVSSRSSSSSSPSTAPSFSPFPFSSPSFLGGAPDPPASKNAAPPPNALPAIARAIAASAGVRSNGAISSSGIAAMASMSIRDAVASSTSRSTPPFGSARPSASARTLARTRSAAVARGGFLSARRRPSRGPGPARRVQVQTSLFEKKTVGHALQEKALQDDVAPPRLSRRARRRGGTVSRTRARGRLEIRGGDRLRLGHVVVRFVGRGRVPRSTASRTSAFHAAPRRRFRPRRSFRAKRRRRRVARASVRVRAPRVASRRFARRTAAVDERVRDVRLGRLHPRRATDPSRLVRAKRDGHRVQRGGGVAGGRGGVRSDRRARLPSPPSPPSLPSFPSLVSSLVSSPSLFPDRPLVPVVSAARSANAAATRVSAMGKKAGRVLSVAARPHSCALENSRSSRRSAACAFRADSTLARAAAAVSASVSFTPRAAAATATAAATREVGFRPVTRPRACANSNRRLASSTNGARFAPRGFGFEPWFGYVFVAFGAPVAEGMAGVVPAVGDASAPPTRPVVVARSTADAKGGASRRGRRRESSRGNAADAADATRGGECLERGNGGGRARDEGARV